MAPQGSELVRARVSMLLFAIAVAVIFDVAEAFSVIAPSITK